MDVAVGAVRRDGSVEIVLLLAFAGGYIDAYTWIIHGVLIVLLRCEATPRGVT
jgi:hypothetical protein